MLTISSYTSGTLCQRKMLNSGETGYLSVDTGMPCPLGSWVRKREGAGLLEMGSVAVTIVLSSGSVA